MTKIFITIITALALGACAFDKDKAANNAKEVAELQRQEAIYTQIVGNYTGKLTTAASQQDVELRLFTLSEPIGTNSDGEDSYRLVLRGNYKKVFPVGPGYNFKVRYIPETGQLILSNVSSTKEVLGVDDIHTIDAKIQGQKIVGEVKSISGVIGIMELTLSTQQSQAPGNTEENEYNERLRRQYESVAGVYAGENVINGKVTFTFKISLQVVKAEGNTPRLIGDFRRDDDPGETVSLNLTANYQAELSPPVLTLTGKSRFKESSGYQAVFTGNLTNGEYKGSWRTNIKGFEGDFALKKIQ